MFELLFVISFVVATISIDTISFLVGLKGKAALFSFLPLSIVYLGFITHALSLFSMLSMNTFMVCQGIILISVVGARVVYKIKRSNHSNVKEQYFTLNFQQKFILIFSLMSLCILVGTSMYLRWNIPMSSWDDLSYRASAPLHWIQNNSVFRFETLNERKNVFLMGTGLLYLWPRLFNVSDQVAVLFFALSYPLGIVAIYVASGMFSKEKEYQILSTVLFASSPIVVSLVVNTLVQEIWLGLAGISFVYFLITDMRSHMRIRQTSYMTGVAFAIILFLKVTAYGYGVIFLAYVLTHKDWPKRLGDVAIGCIITALAIGYITYSFQNIHLYGNLFGTENFRGLHFAHVSIGQITTHLSRFPFIFFDSPLLLFDQTQLQAYMQKISEIIGATRLLPGEFSEAWIGRYSFHFSNIHFGVGGIIWMACMCIAVVAMYSKRLTSKVVHIDGLVFLLLSLIVLTQVVVVRWEEAADLPYRHLVSSFMVASIFFPIFLKRQSGWIKQLLMSLVVFYIFFGAVKQIQVNVEAMQHWFTYTSAQKNDMRDKQRSSVYFSYMTSLMSPQSFLVIDELNLTDVPLFLFRGKYKNTVSLILPHRETKEGFVQAVIKEFGKKQYNALVLSENRDLESLIALYSQNKYTKIELIDANQRVLIYQKHSK